MRALRKEEEERDLDRQEWNRQRRDEEHKWQRSLDTATKVRRPFVRAGSTVDPLSRLQDATQAQNEVAHVKSLLAVRESDLQSLQDALNGLEASSRRQGEESTTDRFALELELDRTKRDLSRCQEDLKKLAAELEGKNKALREKEMELATLVGLRLIRDQRVELTFFASAALREQGPRHAARCSDSDSPQPHRQVRLNVKGESVSPVILISTHTSRVAVSPRHSRRALGCSRPASRRRGPTQHRPPSSQSHREPVSRPAHRAQHPAPHHLSVHGQDGRFGASESQGVSQSTGSNTLMLTSADL